MAPGAQARVIKQLADNFLFTPWLWQFRPTWMQVTVSIGLDPPGESRPGFIFLLCYAGQALCNPRQLQLGLHDILLMRASSGIVVTGYFHQVLKHKQ
jgi:hypothetical protein